MKTNFIFLLCFLFCNCLYAAESSQFNQSNGKVSFSGEHAGMSFSGIFKTWRASLRLPPTDNPKISATFALDSAETGNAMYDETLPESDWFDVENYPEGTFLSDAIISAEGGFQVSGVLTIKDISKPVSFKLIQNGNGLEAKFNINRLDYNIGKESDESAEWVSEFITIELNLLPQ